MKKIIYYFVLISIFASFFIGMSYDVFTAAIAIMREQKIPTHTITQTMIIYYYGWIICHHLFPIAVGMTLQESPKNLLQDMYIKRHWIGIGSLLNTIYFVLVQPEVPIPIALLLMTMTYLVMYCIGYYVSLFAKHILAKCKISI